MLRYFITDRRATPDILSCIRSSKADYIQIREKDLPTRKLLHLTASAIEAAPNARILVNDRIDVALAAGAHGAHLRSDSVAPQLWRPHVPRGFLLAVSCHTIEDVRRAQAADFLVFGPVFSSPGKGPPQGLPSLREAVECSSIPVFALGGITEENAPLCIALGAAGIAAIRLFSTLE